MTKHYSDRDANKDTYYSSKRKPFRYNDNNNKKFRPNPHAQRLILETSIVNEIQNKIAYANAFLLRSFRLSLEMQQEEAV